MQKKYADPQIIVFTANAREDILLNSDVDVDVSSLYGDDINNLLN